MLEGMQAPGKLIWVSKGGIGTGIEPVYTDLQWNVFFKYLLLIDYFHKLCGVYVNVQQLVQYQSNSCVLNTTSALITIMYRA